MADITPTVPTSVAELRRLVVPGATVRMTNHWGLMVPAPKHLRTYPGEWTRVYGPHDRTCVAANTRGAMLTLPGDPSRGSWLDWPKASTVTYTADGMVVTLINTGHSGRSPFVTIHEVR